MSEEISGLGARVHLFVHPNQRAAFTSLFAETLGCNVQERDFGLEFPILVVSFPDGSVFSVEFTTLAADTGSVTTVTDASACRGAWIEFRTTDVPVFQGRLRRAGVPEFSHAGSQHVYFTAPGGQVFRLIDVNYAGP
jgi:predicted homoserine dehydrogenase-like protein